MQSFKLPSVVIDLIILKNTINKQPFIKGGPTVLVCYVALIGNHGIGQITYCRWRCGSLGPPQTRVKKQETRIKKQNGLAHLRFLVCDTTKQKKHCLIRESSFQRNMCETANQQSISSHMVVYMACKMRCR